VPKKKGRESWSFGAQIEVMNPISNQQGIKWNPIAPICLGKSSTLNDGVELNEHSSPLF